MPFKPFPRKYDDPAETETAEYRAWGCMRTRCNWKKAKDYFRYGGAGIKVCARWESYANFLADMGRKPTPDHSLDRWPDQKGNYEPGNVRWATQIEQQRNRSSNHLLTFNGKTQPVIAWCEDLGFTKRTILSRIQAGWSVDRALTEPCRITTLTVKRGMQTKAGSTSPALAIFAIGRSF